MLVIAVFPVGGRDEHAVVAARQDPGGMELYFLQLHKNANKWSFQGGKKIALNPRDLISFYPNKSNPSPGENTKHKLLVYTIQVMDTNK